MSLDDEGKIFMTDQVLAHLMTCTRHVIPWDIIVTKTTNKLFFDKRDGTVFGNFFSHCEIFCFQSFFFLLINLDYVTVNETSADPPLPSEDKEGMNSFSSLVKEASYINQCFSQQVLTTEGIEYDPIPFKQEGDEPALLAYK